MRGYLLLPHLAPVLVVELATAAFAFIAWSGLPPAYRLGPLLLAMLGGQLAIGATNELVDLPYDTVGKPWKPLPSGDVSIRGAQAMLAVGLIMMVAFGSRFGSLPSALLALGTGLGIAYDLWFKRTVWSWLPYLLALPLLPIWVFTSLGKPEPRLLLLYPFGALATVGVHFAQALPDVTIDREAGLETVTSRSDEMRIFVFAWLATLSAPVLAWFAAQWLGASQQLVPIAIASGLAVLLTTLGTGVAWTLIVVR